MSIEFFLGSAFWLACGIGAYGISVAFTQKHFVLIARSWRWRTTIFHFVVGFVGGPFALFATLIVYGPSYGFMLVPFSDREWLAEASLRYPQYRDLFEEEIGGAA